MINARSHLQGISMVKMEKETEKENNTIKKLIMYYDRSMIFVLVLTDIMAD
jgi:hypothetical protein